MSGFWQRLQQRKLVQWAVAYVAFAFALIQVADVVADSYHWPDGVMHLLFSLLALGFIVALLLAWYHGERGAQRANGTELVILMVLLSVGGVLIWRLAPDVAAPAAVPVTHADTAPHAIRSIAVLPLANDSGDHAEDYFTEGMTDQLTTDLAIISKLRVISHSSTMQFMSTSRPPAPEIARLLDVDAVVEGSVLRVRDKVRITAQLIDARADKVLWAKSYERDARDVLALQDAMASAIAEEINVRLTPDEHARLTSVKAVIPAAYDAYLKGRYFFNRPSDENLRKAITQFEQAINLDPDFAPAYSGLSDTYMSDGYNETDYTAAQAKGNAEAAAEQAIRLDDNSAEAHTSLAVFRCYYDQDWAGSEKEFRRAIALNPNYAYAHNQLGGMLSCLGRNAESIEQSQLAARLDPLSPQVLLDAVGALAWQGNLAQARQLIARAAELDPNFSYVPWIAGWIDIEASRPGDAIPALRRAASLQAPPFVTAWLGYAYAASDDRTHALATLDALKKYSLHGYVAPFNLAVIYLGLGDHERAPTYLEQAYVADSQWLVWLRSDRIFDPLRKEPRFIALMDKLGFKGSRP
ncbi:MAG: tetratricopeptide repeat protein [Rhodanobacter sp.]